MPERERRLRQARLVPTLRLYRTDTPRRLILFPCIRWRAFYSAQRRRRASARPPSRPPRPIPAALPLCAPPGLWRSRARPVLSRATPVLSRARPQVRRALEISIAMASVPLVGIGCIPQQFIPLMLGIQVSSNPASNPASNPVSDPVPRARRLDRGITPRLLWPARDTPRLCRSRRRSRRRIRSDVWSATPHRAAAMPFTRRRFRSPPSWWTCPATSSTPSAPPSRCPAPPLGFGVAAGSCVALRCVASRCVVLHCVALRPASRLSPNGQALHCAA